MKKKLKKGFTLVELVIVIAVIAILSAVLIPTFGNVIQNANDSAAFSTASNALTKYTTNQAQAGQSTMLPDGYVIVFDKNATFDIDTPKDIDDNDFGATIKYVFRFKSGSLVQYKEGTNNEFVKYSEVKANVIQLKQTYDYVDGKYSKTPNKTKPLSIVGGALTYYGAFVLDSQFDATAKTVTGKVLLVADATNA